jgi:hypothetical protein
MAEATQRQFCTLFDSNYLLRGLALYRSLMRHSDAFILHVLCMDDRAYELLCKLQLPGMRLIRRADFEDPELLAVKPTRSIAEYCWTCTPSLPLYVLAHNPNVDLITYLDADLYFFSSPEPIFDEFADRSTLIIEHRFSPRLQHFEVNGKYNVEWLTFRRDTAALETLRWWREKCIEWCFHRLEQDRMGDQKYLDTWPERFAGVHVLKHIGAGVAPWNLARYKLTKRGHWVYADELPLIFYHFHGFRLRADGSYAPMANIYLEDVKVPAMIYGPYVTELMDCLDTVRRVDPSFAAGVEQRSASESAPGLLNRLYWRTPASWRTAYRKVVPLEIRARLVRMFGR